MKVRPQDRATLAGFEPELRCSDESCLGPEKREGVVACQPQTDRKTLS